MVKKTYVKTKKRKKPVYCISCTSSENRFCVHPSNIYYTDTPYKQNDQIFRQNRDEKNKDNNCKDYFYSIIEQDSSVSIF